ncbi:hypothetical protein DACRYDRAFT_114088 [Dacryopinax primogenitus]|uniref:PPM-type phosphatase domain-containing protein n=1 Tax=Dacryopinax primogenitus (strain DJM 731) TaxID=1858805 RepID=M5G3G0_DACPD|nr:uncharacterized protein DACRYDRAFT_114088 [Dacryopinax primogenitus]EJU04756.1 hypothetical protein DACRYDRAFT_114088 [Dacryopinax primogenitus]
MSNSNEVKRIQDEHPGEACIIEDQILGKTLVTRTLGDWDQKWPKGMVGRLYPFLPFVSNKVPLIRKRLLTNSISPPYQTARADVTHEKLSGGRVIVIVASDGLPDNSARLTLDQHPDVEKRKQDMIQSWVRSASRKPLEGLEAERIMRDVLGGTDERKVLMNITDWFQLSIWDDLTLIVIDLSFPEERSD